MRYLSVCSGIEAATAAWHPLGWTATAFAEVDAFPSAALAHHYPTVPNHGDMTKFKDWPDADIDLLVGGTPCQSFSVAGLRKGLDDPRGSLLLTYLAITDRYRPKWLVWENVPGVLSADGGRAFGSLLGGLAILGYGFAYRILDAQYFRLAQRRRRVFVVGCLGDWRRAAAVLFERESLSGHPAPCREERQTAPTIPSRRTAGGGLGTDFDCDGGLVPISFAHTVAASERSYIHDKPGRTRALMTRPLAVAFSVKDYGQDLGELSPTLRAGGHANSHANGGCMPAVAFDARQSDVLQYGDKTGPLDTDGSSIAIQRAMQVRRLTPLECERLQGFPDGYTLIPYRGKPAKDGPRYKALGNSMAVPVMRAIGRRIDMVEELQ